MCWLTAIQVSSDKDNDKGIAGRGQGEIKEGK